MNCPHCGFDFRWQNFKGIRMSRCSQCQGVWLYAPELNDLNEQDLTVAHSPDMAFMESEPSPLGCPECSVQMHRFKYRYYEMLLDVCPLHGYWIDREEEKRVLRFMRHEARALMNQQGAEDRWADFLIKLRSPVFWSRLNVI